MSEVDLFIWFCLCVTSVMISSLWLITACALEVEEAEREMREYDSIDRDYA